MSCDITILAYQVTEKTGGLIAWRKCKIKSNSELIERMRGRLKKHFKRNGLSVNVAFRYEEKI